MGIYIWVLNACRNSARRTRQKRSEKIQEHQDRSAELQAKIAGLHRQLQDLRRAFLEAEAVNHSFRCRIAGVRKEHPDISDQIVPLVTSIPPAWHVFPDDVDAGQSRGPAASRMGGVARRLAGTGMAPGEFATHGGSAAGLLELSPQQAMAKGGVDVAARRPLSTATATDLTGV
jgi:hypothetical protein